MCKFPVDVHFVIICLCCVIICLCCVYAHALVFGYALGFDSVLLHVKSQSTQHLFFLNHRPGRFNALPLYIWGRKLCHYFKKYWLSKVSNKSCVHLKKHRIQLLWKTRQRTCWGLKKKKTFKSHWTANTSCNVWCEILISFTTMLIGRVLMLICTHFILGMKDEDQSSVSPRHGVEFRADCISVHTWC